MPNAVSGLINMSSFSSPLAHPYPGVELSLGKTVWTLSVYRGMGTGLSPDLPGPLGPLTRTCLCSISPTPPAMAILLVGLWGVCGDGPGGHRTGGCRLGVRRWDTSALCVGWAEVRAFDLNSKGRCSEPHKGPIVQTLGIKQHMTPQHRALMNWDAGADPGTTSPADMRP